MLWLLQIPLLFLLLLLLLLLALYLVIIISDLVDVESLRLLILTAALASPVATMLSQFCACSWDRARHLDTTRQVAWLM